MKNRFTRLLFYVAVYLPLLPAGGMLASCSMEDVPHGSGTRLPEGEYPVTLSASVEVDTKATSDNFWDGGEQVAVEAVSDMEGVQPEVKTYTVSSGGGLTSDEPLWWTNTGERKTLRAWYCGDGSAAAGRDNASAVPVEWTVRSDQSGNVTLPGGAEADGYQSSDLLFAPEVVAEFAGSAAVPMKFCHQTAKVVVNIKKAEYVTDASQIKAVRIGDGNLILTAGFTAPADGSSAGVWTTDGAEAAGTVTPRKLDVLAKDVYVASYEALLIPQPTAGKRMVAVDTDAGTMYYTAPDDAESLMAGKVRTYNIAVLADRLAVEVPSGGQWQSGGSENIASYINYSSSDLKVGDYFYSDGTWSDGGLRKVYSDGRMEITAEKPEPVLINPGTSQSRTVIGIVFQTDPDRIGQAEKDALKTKGVDEPHGLVMSVKNAATGQQWGPTGQDEGLTPCITKADNYNDISGYGNCEKIRTSRGNFDSHPAFKAADGYNATCPVPETTTGWYLPASGQWWDILQNLGGCTALADEDQQASSDSGDFYWSDQGDVPAALDVWMDKIALDSKDNFNSGGWFWSSSEYSDDHARGWGVNSDDNVGCGWYDKYNDDVVRPVLAF